MDEKTFDLLVEMEVKKTVKHMKKIKASLIAYIDEIIQDIIAEYDNLKICSNGSKLYLARSPNRNEQFNVDCVKHYFKIMFPTSKNTIQLTKNVVSHKQWFLDFSDEDKRKLLSMKHDHRIPTISQTEILKTYKFATYDHKQ
jgi:hypothetical protein